jgi:hypothetical protein
MQVKQNVLVDLFQGDQTNARTAFQSRMLAVLIMGMDTSITRPPSSLTKGRRYVTDGVRLAQRPRRGASRRLR